MEKQTTTSTIPANHNEHDCLLALVRQRRSIRKYSPEPIPIPTLGDILRIAMYAPSSFAQRPVEFVVVTDRDMLRRVAACKKIGAPSVAQAAAAVIVMADPANGELWIEDTSVAATYLLLAAQQFEVGACWNQVRNREGRHGTASADICELLNIPAKYEILCVVAMGFPAENKRPVQDSELDFGKIHFDIFQSSTITGDHSR